MGLVESGIVAVLGIVGAAISRILADDLREWSPRLTSYLIGRAVSRLPEDRRERYAEEWHSHLADTPGSIAKLAVAVGCVSAAGTIRHEQDRGRTREARERELRRIEMMLDRTSDHMRRVAETALVDISSSEAVRRGAPMLKLAIEKAVRDYALVNFGMDPFSASRFMRSMLRMDIDAAILGDLTARAKSERASRHLSSEL